MIKVGIIGAAGYTAGELIRVLINHPTVEIVLLQSTSQAGKGIDTIHKDLIGETNLVFDKEITLEADVFFLCKGHGESKKILESHPGLLTKKIIDLSQDYRLAGSHDFIYGLPEMTRSLIGKSNHIANPGCFATCIQLALLPSVQMGAILSDISVSGITGSTGAGQSPTATTHFSWRSHNASVYKPLKHQHLMEIGETLKAIRPELASKLLFVPYRGAFTRGIITTVHFATNLSEQSLIKAYQDYYWSHTFTKVVNENPDLKRVVGTNKCLVYPKVIEGTGIVVSVIDNLLKGASGQAVQNMNIQFGLNERTGLNLKSSAF